MARKSKTRDITITERGGFFRKLSGDKKEYDFEGISAFRRLISNEKARLLNVVKVKKPKSLYELAKILKRDFKSVRDDVKLLERFGFLDMIAEKSGKRKRLKPVIVVDSILVRIKV